MKKLAMLMIFCVTLPGALFAQRPGQGQGQGRQQLEAQVVERFLDHVTRELQLTPGGRTRLEQHLRQTAPRRRELAEQTAQLRMNMMRATRDPATSEADFTRMIAEMTRLREMEEQVWKADQEALSRLLTPRQHAQFIMMWMRFNEQIRRVGSRRR